MQSDSHIPFHGFCTSGRGRYNSSMLPEIQQFLSDGDISADCKTIVSPNRRLVVDGLVATFVSLGLGGYRAEARADDLPAFRTEGSQFVQLDPGIDVSNIILRRMTGPSVPLRSFRGKAVLINFWASWCAPCRRELPILDAMQSMTGEPFAVVPVSLDRDPTLALRFMRSLGLKHLSTFVDPDGLVGCTSDPCRSSSLRIQAMPMSYVVDPVGRARGYLKGEADWTRPEGLALLRHVGSR